MCVNPIVPQILNGRPLIILQYTYIIEIHTHWPTINECSSDHTYIIANVILLR